MEKKKIVKVTSIPIIIYLKIVFTEIDSIEN